MNFIFLMIMAILPGVGIAAVIYFTDKKEPEPINLLVYSFICGMLSVGIAFLISSGLAHLIPLNEGLTSKAIHAFVIVAFIEESGKFLFVRGLLYPNKNFNEPLDGIVYSVMVGMGFATAENVMYAIKTGGAATLLRMFTAIPAHATFAIIMGYFLGKAKFMHQKEKRYGLFALLAATGFHGVYDYFMDIEEINGMWLLALASLVVGTFLSRKAIQVQAAKSPF